MSNQGELTWRTSSKSGGSSCVAVAADGGYMHVCDSKDPAGATLTFDRDAFRAFVAGLKRGAPFGR